MVCAGGAKITKIVLDYDSLFYYTKKKNGLRVFGEPSKTSSFSVLRIAHKSTFRAYLTSLLTLARQGGLMQPSSPPYAFLK